MTATAQTLVTDPAVDERCPVHDHCVLRVDGLEKSFHRGLPLRRHRVDVLTGASLMVCSGELVGLVGENGSGKSTLMQIVVGLLGRDGGEVERRGRLGYCPQVPMLWDKLTVDEHFALFARAYGLDDDARERAVADLLVELRFERYRRYRVEELSGGTRQKLNLALALMHQPQLLLLDEPYSGFDWETYLRFWEMADRRRTSGSFVREQLRAPLTLALLVAVPAFFVLIFAGVLGTFAEALGGTLASRSATAISAGWAAAFLSGALGFFQVSSSRGADRRLASAGLGAFRVAIARISAALLLAATVSAVAFATLWLRSGIGHPLHAAVAIFAFAAIYIGIGAVVGAFVTGALEGSLLVMLAWSLDAFSGPQMTSSGGGALTPTRDAANLLIAAGAGQSSPQVDWFGVLAVTVVALAAALAAFWFTARTRSA